MAALKIKLSVGARNRLRQEIRNHPKLKTLVSEPKAVNLMPKDELINTAVKLGIDVKEIVSEVSKNASSMAGLFTEEELSIHEHSDQYPAFEGSVEFTITFQILGLTVERLARMEYTYTPEWEYYDLHKKALFTGWPGSVTSLHVRVIPEGRYETSSKGGRMKLAKPRWVLVDLFEGGLISDEMWDAVDNLIEEQCRKEDQARRSAAQLPT